MSTILMTKNKILDGRAISSAILSELKTKIHRLDGIPTLVAILVGDDPASKIYVSMKQKRAKEIGINTRVINLPASTSQEQLHETIQDLNEDKTVDGILLQLPLPQHLDSNQAIAIIDPNKDVDGLNYINFGKLHMGLEGFNPCTPLGVIEMLKRSDVKMEGKDAVVIGRSNLVGKPLARMLEMENATVTLCHSKTRNLKRYTEYADIVVSAVGKPQTITADMIKQGAVVVDVGISRTKNGLVGDVDFELVKLKASKITPVPGGVGPMTIAMLMSNTVNAFERRRYT